MLDTLLLSRRARLYRFNSGETRLVKFVRWIIQRQKRIHSSGPRSTKVATLTCGHQKLNAVVNRFSKRDFGVYGERYYLLGTRRIASK
jgi:hypothetical protein